MQSQPERGRLDKQGKRLFLVPVREVALARLGLEDRFLRHVKKVTVSGGVKLFDDGKLGPPFVPPLLERKAAREPDAGRDLAVEQVLVQRLELAGWLHS